MIIIIACYAEPCISYGRDVYLSVRPFVRHKLALCVKMAQARTARFAATTWQYHRDGDTSE